MRLFRDAAGLSQPQLAARVGIGKGAVADIEHGRSFPCGNLEALSKALGVPLRDLFDFGEGRPRRSKDIELLVQLVERGRLADRSFAKRALAIVKALSGK